MGYCTSGMARKRFYAKGGSKALISWRFSSHHSWHEAPRQRGQIYFLALSPLGRRNKSVTFSIFSTAPATTFARTAWNLASDAQDMLVPSHACLTFRKGASYKERGTSSHVICIVLPASQLTTWTTLGSASKKSPTFSRASCNAFLITRSFLGLQP